MRRRERERERDKWDAPHTRHHEDKEEYLARASERERVSAVLLSIPVDPSNPKQPSSLSLSPFLPCSFPSTARPSVHPLIVSCMPALPLSLPPVHSMGKAARFLSVGKARCHHSYRRRHQSRPPSADGRSHRPPGTGARGRLVGPSVGWVGCTL